MQYLILLYVILSETDQTNIYIYYIQFEPHLASINWFICFTKSINYLYYKKW